MKITCKYFFLLFFFFLIGITFSQNSKIDSLKIELHNHYEKDTVRVNLLNKLAYLYHRKDIDKMNVYIDESEKISKSINFNSGIARCTYLRGVSEVYQSNYDIAIQYLKESTQLYLPLKNKLAIANSYMATGVVYYYKSNYEQSLIFYKKAFKIRKEIGLATTNLKFNIASIKAKIGKYDEAMNEYHEVLELHIKSDYKGGIVNCLNSIASVYEEKGNIALSLEYHNKSLSYAEKIKDSVGIARSFNNIGINYNKQQNYDKALDFYFKALSIFKKQKNKNNIAEVKNYVAEVFISRNELNEAIKYLNESLLISRKIGDKEQVSRCLNNLGSAYLILKEYNLAFENFKRAKEINYKIDNKLGLCSSYIGEAKVYFEKCFFNESLQSALKADKISKDLKLLKEQREIQELLSKIYESKGNYKKALENYEQFKILNDSLFNKENIERIAQLEHEYRYQQALDSVNIRELKLKKTVSITNENLEKTQRNLLLGVIAFLITTLILGSIIFFLKLRNEKSKTQNIVIEQKLLRSQMTPHFIFNSLSVLQGMILSKEEKNAVSYLSKFSKLLRTVLENSRYKIVVLSEELSAINSYMALQNLDVYPPFEYKLTVDSKIDTINLKIPPMLIQPFIENVIEHAFPNKIENKQIKVTLMFKEEKLICTIEDNGIGVDEINQKLEKNKNSLATTITSERLAMLSKEFKNEGAIEVQNRKIFGEEGTLVTLVVPYKIEPV
jgi:tetratricopeptide (TPR) repeat protein